MLTIAPPRLRELRRRRLREEQRRAQVGADQLVPVAEPRSAPTAVGIELEALLTSTSSRPKRSQRRVHQRLRRDRREQVGLHLERAARRARRSAPPRAAPPRLRRRGSAAPRSRRRRAAGARSPRRCAARAGDQRRFALAGRRPCQRWNSRVNSRPAPMSCPHPSRRRSPRAARCSSASARSWRPAATGSASRATWSSRCTRRGWATTRAARASSAPRAISSPRPNSRRCSAARSRARSRSCCSPARRSSSSAPAAGRSPTSLLGDLAPATYLILETSAELRAARSSSALGDDACSGSTGCRSVSAA